MVAHARSTENLVLDLETFTDATPISRRGLLLYTEGVRQFAERAGAWWLIDVIATFQGNAWMTGNPELEWLQIWTLEVQDQNSAYLTCKDGEGGVVWDWFIRQTDFPFDEFSLIVQEGVLRLPSEG